MGGRAREEDERGAKGNRRGWGHGRGWEDPVLPDVTEPRLPSLVPLTGETKAAVHRTLQDLESGALVM